MTDNLAIFLLMAVAIGAAVALTLLSPWLRGLRREAEVSSLKQENDHLKGLVSGLEERLRLLERHAAEPEKLR